MQAWHFCCICTRSMCVGARSQNLSSLWSGIMFGWTPPFVMIPVERHVTNRGFRQPFARRTCVAHSQQWRQTKFDMLMRVQWTLDDLLQACVCMTIESNRENFRTEKAEIPNCAGLGVGARGACNVR